MYSNCSEARKVSSGLDVLVFESITGFITLVYNNSSGSRGEGGGGGYSPPSPLILKIHSILCMGVLGDNTIGTAVHQVVNYMHVRVFHRWQRAWQDHLKRLNSKYTDSPSLFSTTFRD